METFKQILAKTLFRIHPISFLFTAEVVVAVALVVLEALVGFPQGLEAEALEWEDLVVSKKSLETLGTDSENLDGIWKNWHHSRRISTENIQTS